MRKEKISSINILYVAAMVCVFFYHAYHNMGCDYGILNPFISRATFWMTLFFEMSGFILYYNYESVEFGRNGMKYSDFYKKRFSALFPIYALIFVIFAIYRNNMTTTMQDIAAFPFQILMWQNFSSYNYLVNSGTWFFSCLFICYLVFPLIKEVVSETTERTSCVLLVVLSSFLLFAPILSILYKIETYQNAFLRIFEFFIGALAAKLYLRRSVPNDNGSGKTRKNELVPAFLALFIFVCVMLARDKMVRITNAIVGVESLAAVFLIYSFAADKSGIIKKLGHSRIISLGRSYALEIWSATFFTTEIWNLYFRNKASNYPMWMSVTSTFLINLCIAFVLKWYRNICGRVIQKKGLKFFFGSICILLIVIFTVSGIFDRIEKSEFDFQGSMVDTSNMEGVYDDEGDYAWVASEGKMILQNNKNKHKLRLVASYSEEYILNGLKVHLLINGTEAAVIDLSEENQEFLIDVPDVSRKDLEITFAASDSFIPAEISDSADSRELSFRLYYCGLV